MSSSSDSRGSRPRPSLPRPNPTDRRLPWIAGGLALLTGTAAIWAISSWSLLIPVRDSLDAALVAIQDGQVARIYLSPLFWLLIAGVLVLERLLPARRGQPVFSRGFFQDAGYFVLISLFRIFVLTYYIAFLVWIYEENLSFLTVRSIAAWPPWAKLVLAVLLADLLGWLHHWVRHKVPTLWKFHTIHHSQEEVNIFTDVRYHPLEYLVSQAIIFIPVMMFESAFPLVVGYAFVHQWYTKFYHANIRTNLGPLRWVLVTPQSHRIHHSHDPVHRDRNFGVIFCTWDRMFGTQYPDCDAYPETGVDDESFPRDREVKGVLPALWRQLAYPFRALARERRAGGGGS